MNRKKYGLVSLLMLGNKEGVRQDVMFDVVYTVEVTDFPLLLVGNKTFISIYIVEYMTF